MKKPLFFLFMLLFITLFCTSCPSLMQQSIIAITLTGASDNAGTVSDLMPNKFILSIYNSSGTLVETDEFYSKDTIQLTKSNFTGSYNFKIKAVNTTEIVVETGVSRPREIYNGEKAVNIAAGNNSFSINTDFKQGTLIYNANPNSLQLNFESHLKNSSSGNEIITSLIPSIENKKQITVFPGNYSVFYNVFENSSSLLLKSPASNIKIYPDKTINFTFGDVSKNNITIISPWSEGIKNPGITFNDKNYATIKWDLFNADQYEISFKSFITGKFHFISKLTAADLDNTSGFSKWTDTGYKSEPGAYGVNSITTGKPSGIVEIPIIPDFKFVTPLTGSNLTSSEIKYEQGRVPLSLFSSGEWYFHVFSGTNFKEQKFIPAAVTGQSNQYKFYISSLPSGKNFRAYITVKNPASGKIFCSEGINFYIN